MAEHRVGRRVRISKGDGTMDRGFLASPSWGDFEPGVAAVPMTTHSDQCPGLEESHLLSPRNGLIAVGDAELAEDMGHVGLDGID